MTGIRYTEEFKLQAIKQITERGHKITEVARRLGISYKTLSKWQKTYVGLSDGSKQGHPTHADLLSLKQENARLNAALKRATEERDILKKAAVYFANQSK